MDLLKSFTVRMDGVPLPLSMCTITLWVVPFRATTLPCIRLRAFGNMFTCGYRPKQACEMSADRAQNSRNAPTLLKRVALQT
jgi:hypothetical protein